MHITDIGAGKAAHCLACVSLLLICAAAAAANAQTASKDSCLLQQRSESRQLPRTVQLEDTRYRVAKSAPARQPKSEGSHGGKTKPDTKSPWSESKKAPKHGGKSEADQDPDAGPTYVESTPVEEIVADKIMTQRAELHLTHGLLAMEEEYGSVNKFAEAVRKAALVDMQLDPRRLVILNVLGQYVDENSSAHEDEDGHVARVDFEVLPGPPGTPTPDEVIKKLALMMRQKEGEMMKGTTSDFMDDAALIISSGLKATSPSADFQHTHNVDKDDGPQSGHSGHHGHHNGGHNGHSGHHHHHSDNGRDTEGADPEVPGQHSDGSYPWQWSTWGWGGSANSLRPFTVLAALLTCHVLVA